jgi:hypothetical protein
MERWVGHVMESCQEWSRTPGSGNGWVPSNELVNKRFDPFAARKAAKAIADAYYQKFTYYSAGSHYSSEGIYKDSLYDFLYVNNFDGWLLNAIKALSSTYRRGLQDFLMRLHTGESVVKATPDWDWKQREALGQRLLRELAQAIMTARETEPEFGRYRETEKKAVDEMRRLLELEGYVYKNGVLLVPEESLLDEQEEQGLLESLFDELALKDRSTLKHHLDLSSEHYREGRWDDSIANSRKVLELVLREVARRHSEAVGAEVGADELDKPVRVRDHLQDVGLLEEKEKDAVAKIYGLLSDTGGHPYIAEKDQARLLRHYALTTCQFVLLRLKGALGRDRAS